MVKVSVESFISERLGEITQSLLMAIPKDLAGFATELVLKGQAKAFLEVQQHMEYLRNEQINEQRQEDS